MGTAPIDTVEIIKNGDVIGTMHGEFRQTSLTEHVFVQINFASSSESTGRDNPRGYRPWMGSLEVSGARVKTVTTPGFQDGRFEWARQDWENENRVEFATATRGRVNTMVLELEGVSAETSIRVLLKKGRESGAAPIRIRPYAKIPSEDFSFGFDEFVGGRLSREFQVEHYTDEISMQLIDPKGELDKRFEFTDDLEPRRGDYYYVRVRQMNGAQAWSSPFWVGGESPR